jgi:hypothetical protein
LSALAFALMLARCFWCALGSYAQWAMFSTEKTDRNGRFTSSKLCLIDVLNDVLL